MIDVALLEFLKTFVLDRKLDLFNEKLNNRTRHITIALENLFQEQNASAIIRTAECFGLQDIHVIENDNNFKINTDIVNGGDRWVNLHKYHPDAEQSATLKCINSLKQKGYKIIATTPHTNDCNLNDFNVADKFALFFGEEKPGVSSEIIDNADGFLKIPIYGFTESFNVSVAAAIIIHHLQNKIVNSPAINWQLSDDEKQEIMYNWVVKTVPKSKKVIDYYYQSKK
ncbi:MAG: RNA methyltransferase [Bacteroidota bacterium]